MRLIFLVFLLVLAVAAGVASKIASEHSLKNKPAPIYKTIDPALQPIVDDYKSMASEKGINFTHEVSIGFMDIDHEDIVGICNYGSNFREIDLDRTYFNKITALQRRELVFHELTHCYCLRKHDFDEGKPYPEANDSKFSRGPGPLPRMPPQEPRSKFMNIFWIAPGFFVDGCPTSIMYPYVLSNSCFERHQEHYEKEMFERCTPY